MSWLALPLFAAVVLLFAYGVYRIFRRGMRDSVLAEAPYFEMGFYAFVAPVIGFVGDRITSDDDPLRLMDALLIGIQFYLIGAVIWAAGFAFGRFRARKANGQLTSR